MNNKIHCYNKLSLAEVYSCDLIGFVFTNSSQTCSNNILSFSTTLSYVKFVSTLYTLHL